MYFISCRFRTTSKGEIIKGYAVCSDPNTVVTFVMPDGQPYQGEVWSYTLQHYSPWAKLETQ